MDRPRIMRLLNISPSDIGENFTSYAVGPLTVSIIVDKEEAHE
jgi:hypothetical protein